MRPGRLAVLGAVPLLAVLGSQGMALGATGSKPVRVTASIRATGEDTSPTRTYGAPYLAVDPDNPDVIVAATPEMRTRACRFMRSLDAGRTWKLMDAFPSPESYPFCFHTSGTSTESPIAFGRKGSVYYALNGWDNQDVGVVTGDHPGTVANFSVLVAKTTNLGESWDPVMVRNTRGKTDPNQLESDRPITGLAVDHAHGSQDIVYVGWNQGFPQASPTVPSQTVVATSVDGGKTYSDPVKVVGDYWKTGANKPDPDKWGGGSPSMTVGGDGTLYVVFTATTAANSQPAGTQNNSLMLGKSTDHGKTFAVSQIAAPSGYYQAPTAIAWSPKGGPQGTVHITYEDKISTPALGDRDVFTRRSTDGGKTWSDPKQLNDDLVDPKDSGHTQNNPAITVAPNGRVDAVWWDFRNDIGLFTNDVYYSYSNDNGATWSKNVQVNDRTIDRRLGVWSNGYDMRQPVGIVSTDKLAVMAWDDTRNADVVTQGQDVYAGVVQHAAIGTGSANGLRYAIAGLIGLASVGLILLVVSLASGKRAPAAPAMQPLAAKGRVGTS